MKPELLSPAGDFSTGKVALDAGADCIYLGGELFSARASAKNFSFEDIEKISLYAHRRRKKIYIAINTLVFNDEISELVDFIKHLSLLSIDAFIVQDLGVLTLLQKALPHVPLHASTQMTVHNSLGVKMLEQMGLNRVVLARECTLDDVRLIHDKTKADLEVFAHGALCVSYSGNCYMSSFIGGRSGNRGACAQPCRQKYKLFDKDNLKLRDGYLLSTKDIQTIDMIPELINAGVKSFKIEGRMKKKEYVYQTTTSYRHAIDYFLENNHALSKKQLDKEIYKNALLFNRGGFSHGHLQRDTNVSLTFPYSPKNQGVELGSVIDIKGNQLRIKLKFPLHIGDGLAFYDDQRQLIDGFSVEDIFNTNNKKILKSRADETIAIPWFNHKMPVSVYKTYDLKINESINQKILAKTAETPYQLYAFLKLHVGETPELTYMTESHDSVTVSHKYVVQKAKTAPVTTEYLQKHLGRLGNTIFELSSLEVDMDPQSYIPASILNELRQRALLELSSRNKITPSEIEETLYHYLDRIPPQVEGVSSGILSLKVNTKEKLDRALELNCQRIIYALNSPEDLMWLNPNYKQNIILSLPTIIHESNISKWHQAIKEYGLNYKWMVGNLGGLYLLKDLGISDIATDWPFNITNDVTIMRLIEEGVTTITVSPELSKNRLASLSMLGNIPTEVVVQGHQQLMTLAGNILKLPQNDTFFYLENIFKDRFAVKYFKDQDTTSIFSREPIAYFEDLSLLKKFGIDYFQIDTTSESTETMEILYNCYSALLYDTENAMKETATHLEKIYQGKWKSLT